MRKYQGQFQPGYSSLGQGNTISYVRKYVLAIISIVLMAFLTSCGQGGDSAVQAKDESESNGKSLVTKKGKGFSADMIVSLSSGQKLLEGRIFVTPEAHRMDWKQGAANLSSIRIERENKEYLYNHDKKIYYVMDLNKEEDISNFLKSINDYEEIEVLGKERVSGLNCTKKKVRSSFEVMGMTITNEMIIWQADGIDFPIRVEGEDGTVTELKNISKRAPSSKLFQPIEGYRQVNDMISVMGFG